MKTKNPFKMWGSYIGFVLGLALWYYSFNIGPNTSIGIFFRNILGYASTMSASMSSMIIFPIVGFILGWIVEYIIRKNKFFGLK